MSTGRDIGRRGCARRRLLRALLLAAAVGPGAAHPVGSAPPALAQASGVGADEAAALVRAAVGGRVLDVRPETRGGARVWRVKVLLPGGRVRAYRVDAASGRIL